MTISFSPGSPFQSRQFTLGVATSSFQIEGGVTQREPCIWDTFCRQPGAIRDASNGDVACNHIELWEQDIEMVAELGFDAYRFSIAWPRVMRRDGSVNKQGVAFYQQIIHKLDELGMRAYVTLYHWDLPQWLEDEGGWLNRQTAFAFADYVDVITQALGDKVYSYATLNEPFCSGYLGYELGIHAPGIQGKEFGKKAIHHLLLAHGLAMRVLRRNAPQCQNGIVLNFSPFYPVTEAEQDRRACELAHAHFNDWYIRPVLCGEYPALLEQLPVHHRPDIVDGDLAIIAEPIDFIGINYYTRERVRAKGNDFEKVPPQQGAEITAMGWEVYPQGLTDILLRLHQDYKLPPVLITENGLASDDYIEDGEINDVQRIRYLQSHMNAVERAIEQGMDIQGYFVWSLLDNFEWAEGYLKRFGIVHVDYATQTRTLKASALALQQWLKKR